MMKAVGTTATTLALIRLRTCRTMPIGGHSLTKLLHEQHLWILLHLLTLHPFCILQSNHPVLQPGDDLWARSYVNTVASVAEMVVERKVTTVQMKEGFKHQPSKPIPVLITSIIHSTIPPSSNLIRLWYPRTNTIDESCWHPIHSPQLTFISMTWYWHTWQSQYTQKTFPPGNYTLKGPNLHPYPPPSNHIIMWYIFSLMCPFQRGGIWFRVLQTLKARQSSWTKIPNEGLASTCPVALHSEEGVTIILCSYVTAYCASSSYYLNTHHTIHQICAHSYTASISSCISLLQSTSCSPHHKGLCFSLLVVWSHCYFSLKLVSVVV